jgi:pimeloyl-ACP methyl ester carboxylesterase
LTGVLPRDREGYVNAMVRARRLIGSPGFPFDEERARRIAGLGWERGTHPEGTLRQMLAIIASGDRTARLRDVKAPTVVIHGEEDPLIGVSGGRATAAAIPGSKLIVIPGMGHDVPAEVWSQVGDAIAANARRA